MFFIRWWLTGLKRESSPPPSACGSGCARIRIRLVPHVRPSRVRAGGWGGQVWSSLAVIDHTGQGEET